MWTLRQVHVAVLPTGEVELSTILEEDGRTSTSTTRMPPRVARERLCELAKRLEPAARELAAGNKP